MKLTLLAVGKLKNTLFEPIVAEYQRRLRCWSLTTIEVPVSTPLQEMQTFLERCPTQALHVLFDARGDLMDSMTWAQELRTLQLQGHKHVALWIGGPEGLHPEVYTLAHTTLSFGRLTWPHLMVRTMVMEQLYRAQQILEGHPYHK